VTVGTSFSAPLVSGTLALAIAARSTLDANGVVHQDLTPKDLRALVQRTARDFPSTGAPAGTPECHAPDETTTQEECYCTTDTCGAGMLDAAAAVAAAVGVIPRVTVVTDDPRADETIVLTAADSLPSLGLVGNVTRAAWRIVDGNGIVDNFQSASGLETTVRPTGSGHFTVELTATDSSGASAKVEEEIEVSGDGSGNDDDGNDWGSGALGVGWLAGLLAAVVAARVAVRRGGRAGRSSGG
jgi:serine protease